MEITCWNCKTVTKLDKAGVEAALAAMDTAKLGFHDVSCASCSKSNRTTRDVFEADLQALLAAEAAAAAPVKKEKKDKDEEVNVREMVKAREELKKKKGKK